jgi:hypothetical protein
MKAGTSRSAGPGMRRALPVLVFAVVAGIHEVSAQQPASPVLVEARPTPSEPLRFFGGRTVSVPLVLHTTQLEGLSVRAELVQLSASLAAPVAGQIDVPFALPARPAVSPASELVLSVSLPVVRRETDFELRFRSFQPGERVGRAAGRVALRVYPADVLEPVRVWAESHAIRLEDDHGAVTELFRQQRIAVTESGHPHLTVFAGSRSTRGRTIPRHGSGLAAIFFTEREAATPHLVVERTGEKTTVTVEMYLLDRLATDPLAQKMFLEAFRHAAIPDEAASAQGAPNE